MASVNLGRIGFVNQGQFDDTKEYKLLDIVKYNDNIYSCIQATGSDGNPVKPDDTNGSDYWQLWVEKPESVFVYKNENSDYNANKNEYIFADTSSNAFTVTLPSEPSEGDTVIVSDVKDSFDTNNLTLDGNGKTVEGDSTYVLDVKSKQYSIVYYTNDWRVF